VPADKFRDVASNSTQPLLSEFLSFSYSPSVPLSTLF